MPERQELTAYFYSITCNTFLCNVSVSCGRYLEAEDLEKTFKFKQRDIANVVDVASAKKVIVLDVHFYIQC